MICANQINLRMKKGRQPIDPESLLPRIEDEESKKLDSGAILSRLRELKEQSKEQ